MPFLISPDPQLVIPAKAGIQSLLLLDSAKSRSQSLDSRQKHAGMTSQSHSPPSVQLRIEANQVRDCDKRRRIIGAPQSNFWLPAIPHAIFSQSLANRLAFAPN